MRTWTISVTTLLAATLGASALWGCAARSAQDASPGAVNSRAEQARPDDAGRPVPAATAPLRELGYQIEWFVPGAASAGCRFIDPAGDLVLVHDAHNVLSAREASTGQRRWGATLATPVAKFVGNMRLDDRIIVSGESEVQYLSARTGDLLDRQRLASLANTRPLQMGRFLIYGCASGEVLGHDMAAGYKKWGHMLEGRITANPTLVGSRVLAVSQTGEIIAIDPVSGRGSRPARPLYTGLDNSPVADARIALIAGLDQSIYAYNHADLSLRWRVRTDAPLKDQPTLANRTAYVTVPTSGLKALDASTGEEKWTATGIHGSVIATNRGDLIVWDGSTMRRLDPTSGDVIASEALPGVSMVVADGFEDAQLYLMMADGTLAKYARRAR